MWSTFDIAVPEAVAAARGRLAATLASGNRRFTGALTDDGFEVRRVLRWNQRTFEITAWVRFDAVGDGTVVRVGTGPREWQLWVVVGWSVLWVVLYAERFRDYQQQGGAAAAGAAHLGMIAFAWLLMVVGTAIEERTYRRRLTELFTTPTAPG